MDLAGLYQRLKHRPRIRRNIIFVSFLLFAVIITWLTIGVINYNYQIEQEIEDLQNENQLLTELTDRLGIKIIWYQSLDYLILQAKQQDALVGPGEKSLLLERQKLEAAKASYLANQPDPDNNPATTSNWYLWWHFFFGQERFRSSNDD